MDIESILSRMIDFLRQTNKNFIFFFDNIDIINHDFLDWADALSHFKVLVTSREPGTFKVDGFSSNKTAAWPLFSDKPPQDAHRLFELVNYNPQEIKNLATFWRNRPTLSLDDLY